jgi:transposase
MKEDINRGFMDIDRLPPLNQLTSNQKDELINELLLLVKSLKQRVEELESKVNQNSHNSHKPPSSDGFKRIQRQTKKSPNKSGGQIGHRGQTLKLADHPDRTVDYPVEVCPYCQTDLRNKVDIGYKKAQVFEIPQLKIEVTEHRFFEKICPCCGHCCSSLPPKGLSFGAQYGKRLKAFLVYLHYYQLIPSRRICEFFQDIFIHSLGEGAIFEAVRDVFVNLEDFENKLKWQIQEEEVVHSDETSLRINGKNEWLHVASSQKLTSYFVHQRRGKKAMDEMGILPNFKKILVHDHWKAYFQYSCEHALCNAHHLRELEAVFEGTSHEWARNMQNLLKEIKQAKEKDDFDISLFEQKYDTILSEGFSQAKVLHERGPPTKRKSYPKEVCLLDRLKNRKRQVLMFMYKQDVPFDNNLAERDIRMMKVKMKISGCFRQKVYALIFCRIRSYISTCKKKGFSILDALKQAFNGQALSYLTP